MSSTNLNHQSKFESKIKSDLMDKETLPQNRSEVGEKACSLSGHSSEKISGIETCRVCQCLESDKRGDAALEFLGIVIPVGPTRNDHNNNDDEKKLDDKSITKEENDPSLKKNVKETRLVELVSPDGEILVCKGDLETGLEDYEETLIELGCSCKNDLALVHYACALKWFVNHGSIICEICGNEAKNIRNADYRKVICSLKEYESLRERTDAVAAIRRQRLSEISLWFGPHNNRGTNSNNVEETETVSELSLNVVTEEVRNGENPATKWAVEATGILLATGLLTITLAWLLAPRVGKKTARSGLHILLGGICALTVVVFFRFFVLTRIKYGPARYWAILFVFWFLVFGIWASRTHAAHTT